MFEAGFLQSQHDYSLFFKKEPDSITLLVVYVDDIIITENNSKSIEELNFFLHSKLQIKNLGNLIYF